MNFCRRAQLFSAMFLFAAFLPFSAHAAAVPELELGGGFNTQRETLTDGNVFQLATDTQFSINPGLRFTSKESLTDFRIAGEFQQLRFSTNTGMTLSQPVALLSRGSMVLGLPWGSLQFMMGLHYGNEVLIHGLDGASMAVDTVKMPSSDLDIRFLYMATGTRAIYLGVRGEYFLKSTIGGSGT